MTAPALTSRVDVRRADERFVTRSSWLDSTYSCSFGNHPDPGNTHHGLLLVDIDDVVKPGRSPRPGRRRSSCGRCTRPSPPEPPAAEPRKGTP